MNIKVTCSYRLLCLLLIMLTNAGILSACNELVHLWQPLKEVTDAPYLSSLAGDMFWNRVLPVLPLNSGNLHISLNASIHESLGYDMLHEVADNTTISRSSEQGDNSQKSFPRLEVIVPAARSSMQMMADMVCYFGITVRASMYSEFAMRYCLLGKASEVIAIDEVPLKAGLEIDWVFNGNHLAGGMGVHRVALFDGNEVKEFTLWSKTDLDKIAAGEGK